MPFTPAHVMAVLPGVRWADRVRLDPTCLVIGSMAPDFEYFVRGEQVSTISHTLLGLVVWNLPATLVLAVIWHALVKAPVATLLPRALAAVLAQPWRPAWNAAAVVTVVASALLGAATHVGWDSITHADTFVTDRIAALRAAYDVPFVGPRTLHRILQHASTLVGLAATAWYLVRATRRASAAPPPIGSRLYVALVLAAGIAAGVAAMVVRMRSMHLTDPGSLIAGTISGVLAGTLVASVIVRITGGRR